MPTLQRSIPIINDNNNYVNLHDVANLGLYNKLILVTQKQVLELYITVIGCKTLYGLCVPHTAFPNSPLRKLLIPVMEKVDQLREAVDTKYEKLENEITTQTRKYQRNYIK